MFVLILESATFCALSEKDTTKHSFASSPCSEWVYTAILGDASLAGVVHRSGEIMFIYHGDPSGIMMLQTDQLVNYLYQNNNQAIITMVQRYETDNRRTEYSQFFCVLLILLVFLDCPFLVPRRCSLTFISYCDATFFALQRRKKCHVR